MIIMDALKQQQKYYLDIFSRIDRWDERDISILYEAIIDAYEHYVEYRLHLCLPPGVSSFENFFGLNVGPALDVYFLDADIYAKVYGMDEEGYCLLRYDLNNPNRSKDIQHISKVILSC